jgi:hypothetical protein
MAKWGRLGHFSGPTVQHKVKPDFHILTHRLVKQIERHMDKCHIGTKNNKDIYPDRSAGKELSYFLHVCAGWLSVDDLKRHLK